MSCRCCDRVHLHSCHVCSHYPVPVLVEQAQGVICKQQKWGQGGGGVGGRNSAVFKGRGGYEGIAWATACLSRFSQGIG